MANNFWNNIVKWFGDRSERSKLINNFNDNAREAFISGMVPTCMHAKNSNGDPKYKHQWSSWINRGFRIEVFAGGAPLSKDEIVLIGQVILNDSVLVRRLVVLGWDTLEVHDKSLSFGVKWALMEYAGINGRLIDSN